MELVKHLIDCVVNENVPMELRQSALCTYRLFMDYYSTKGKIKGINIPNPSEVREAAADFIEYRKRVEHANSL